MSTNLDVVICLFMLCPSKERCESQAAGLRVLFLPCDRISVLADCLSAGMHSISLSLRLCSHTDSINLSQSSRSSLTPDKNKGMM